jgi:hypothetical protein
VIRRFFPALLSAILVSCASNRSVFGDNHSDTKEATRKLTKDQIEKTVRDNIGEVTGCLKLAGSGHAPIGGGTRDKVETLFSVESSGEVSRCKVVDSSFSESEVGNCVCATLSKWKFPTRKSAESVRYPFTFVRNIN